MDLGIWPCSGGTSPTSSIRISGRRTARSSQPAPVWPRSSARVSLASKSAWSSDMGQPTSALVRRSRSDTIRELSDRQQIEELMSRYAHAVDRHDTDLIRQVYHSDATDWHGPFRGNVEGFIAWVNP